MYTVREPCTRFDIGPSRQLGLPPASEELR
jgi:hypothetical protein